MGRKKVVYVQQQPQQNSGGCGSSILALLVLGGIASVFSGGDSDTDEERNTTTETTTTEYIEELSNEEQFAKDFAEYQPKDIIEDIYEIYTDKIGFEEIEFKEQLDDSLNYEITADGYATVVTIMDNDDYRIFKPNSSFVFYENGEVITTVSDLENQTMDNYELGSHYIIAKSEIENCLKNPKSADFPSQNEISYQKKDDLIAIKGYVYAENSFGATVKSDWVIQYYIHDLDNFNYTVTYVEIDGNSSGEWIEFE